MAVIITTHTPPPSPLQTDDVDELVVTLIDTISSQIIFRSGIIHGRGPVAVCVVENDVYVSYWNGVAQRSEVSVVSLYEVSGGVVI